MNTWEQAFKRSIDDIRFSPGEKASLCSRLEKAAALQKKGGGQMNKKKMIPRAAVIAAVLILGTTATVFAAGKIRSVGSHSQSGYDYTTCEELTKALENADIAALPETLAGGFSMDGGTLVTNEGLDEENNAVESWESYMITYRSDEGRTVYVDVSRQADLAEEQSSWPEPTEQRTIRDVEVRYDHTEHFMVPPDYEVDEETKKRAEEDDHFTIGYGAAEPGTMYFDTIRFTAGGTYYDVFSSDGLSGDKLFAIAEELIER